MSLLLIPGLSWLRQIWHSHDRSEPVMTKGMFKILKRSKISRARLGLIATSRGRIETPFFTPDATFGQIKCLGLRDLADLGLECLVVNTLHLFLRPGKNIIARAGGLNNYTGWRRPILSDSGGYQVFSLIHRNKSSASPGRAPDKSGSGGRITDLAAIFRSPLGGSRIKLTPEQSISLQFNLGAQMMVCLDDCPPNDYDEAKLEAAVRRTILWAKRCRRQYDKEIKSRGFKNKRPLLFAVIQGGNNLALREFCAGELKKIGFDGFGFGARHIDERGNFLSQALEKTAGQIPENKLRFCLGIGQPRDIIRSVKMGWDMFDCVIPTREGRHGRLFLGKRISNFKFQISNNHPENFYETINITNAKFAKDFSPINEASRLPELKRHSKAYLNYLFKIKEPLALRLASLNNLEFYIKLLGEIRGLIKKNKF